MKAAPRWITFVIKGERQFLAREYVAGDEVDFMVGHRVRNSAILKVRRGSFLMESGDVVRKSDIRRLTKPFNGG